MCIHTSTYIHICIMYICTFTHTYIHIGREGWREGGREMSLPEEERG